ncbi:small-molecule methyltransferase IraA [Legionella geestiana]|uniref:Small-molecule methyltransferase IraA n=1 Tax=Legionella geestiana TaxID=45065 RepID=A0A0W0TSN4_9GAMM|nr:class I SAM-dependent methyltransferase [Legionella geestiana]KTC98528.1 small-molecule methyltransferase IraA [Legionella geestiana]QBS13070.1 class I SAM-dependent methyltransferase [Legionella geestiana]QDQ39250.1 class I SAM-dependent methyltransferase [Legionella geestiana]STX54416.1 small-molecule methyltransferase IraA [Legionella geestiana]
MTLKAMYNTIAEHYATANRFGAITRSHDAAIAQIERFHLGQRPNYKVLDFGVGDGAFASRLNDTLADAHFTGIDVSREMLKRASSALPLTTIEASAADADRFLPPHSQDLVLAHFINAYIPISTLFREANLLTRANGHFSLITTTYESFPLAQRYLAEFIAKDTLLGRIVGHYYKAVVKNTTVANDLESLLNTFHENHFEVIAHERLSIPITINNVEELARFGIEGTWFLNTLSIRMLPRNFLLERLKRLFTGIFTFPYHDTHIIDVILAKK